MRRQCPVCDGRGYENELNRWGIVESKPCYYCVGAGWLESIFPEVSESVVENQK